MISIDLKLYSQLPPVAPSGRDSDALNFIAKAKNGAVNLNTVPPVCIRLISVKETGLRIYTNPHMHGYAIPHDARSEWKLDVDEFGGHIAPKDKNLARIDESDWLRCNNCDAGYKVGMAFCIRCRRYFNLQDDPVYKQSQGKLNTRVVLAKQRESGQRSGASVGVTEMPATSATKPAKEKSTVVLTAAPAQSSAQARSSGSRDATAEAAPVKKLKLAQVIHYHERAHFFEFKGHTDRYRRSKEYRDTCIAGGIPEVLDLRDEDYDPDKKKAAREEAEVLNQRAAERAKSGKSKGSHKGKSGKGGKPKGSHQK